MTYKQLIYAGLVFATLIFTGCEREFPTKLQETNLNALVVDGLITNELKPQHIYLSISNSKLNLPSEPVLGATVVVSDGSNNYEFYESTVNHGSYYSLPFQAVVGKKYSLTINYKSTTYIASESMVPVTELLPIDISKEKDSNLYTYNNVKGGDPAMIEVIFDWTGNYTYTNKYGSNKAQATYYVLKNLDINEALGADRQVIRFPEDTKIVRRKYSLSKDYQAFARSLLMETEWRGGIFDVQQGNVTTNISNGALGFFTVCMVVMDSMIVK